ncbi:MAG: hypothetical protein QXI39_06690 [Candidatus Bathyarchaeia archaeon]
MTRTKTEEGYIQNKIQKDLEGKVLKLVEKALDEDDPERSVELFLAARFLRLLLRKGFLGLVLTLSFSYPN